MKNLIFALTLFVIMTVISTFSFSQSNVEGVCISSTNEAPHSSAMFEVKSTTKGVLLPNLTDAQMLAIPNPKGDGLCIYNTDHHSYYYWDGLALAWKIFGSSQWLYDPLDNNNIYYLQGNVGVGLDHPLDKLHVKTNVRIEGWINGGSNPHPYSSFPALIFSAEGDVLQGGLPNGVSISQGLITYHNSYCDMPGHPNPVCWLGRFEINDNVHVDGHVWATSIYETSDSTMKKNITRISNTVSGIKNLKGYSYNWNNNKFGTELQYGLLAQEVEAVYPNLVMENEGVKSINYTGMITVLLEAIKEQQTKIETLEQRIQVLENR